MKQDRKRHLTLTYSLILLILTISSNPVYAQEERFSGQEGIIVIAAAITSGLAFIGAAIALGRVGSAAIAAVAEKPEIFSLTFVYVVFIEAIAIYGLVLAFMIIGLL